MPTRYTGPCRKKYGIVSKWDQATLKGEVTHMDDVVRSFTGTCFNSGRPTRWPIVGDEVEVVLTSDWEVLAIFLLEDA